MLFKEDPAPQSQSLEDPCMTAAAATKGDVLAFDRYSAGLLPRVARSLCHRLLSSISRSVRLST